MADRLELTLRIALNRSERMDRLDDGVEEETAFFILGLIHAEVTNLFGEQGCLVELLSASGSDPSLVQAMNSFARRHQRALQELNTKGRTIVTDQDVLNILQLLQDVQVTPLHGSWLVTREQPDEILPLEADVLKH